MQLDGANPLFNAAATTTRNAAVFLVAVVVVFVVVIVSVSKALSGSLEDVQEIQPLVSGKGSIEKLLHPLRARVHLLLLSIM